MRRVVGFCLAVSALSIIGAGCGGTRQIAVRTPVEVVKIDDSVFFHNMSITYDPDEESYLTVNGGNDGYGIINEYDTDGELLTSYEVDVDGRAIFYRDSYVLVKSYGTQVYDVNLLAGLLDLGVVLGELPEAPAEEIDFTFAEDNSSPAMSTDGKLFFEHVRGMVTVYDAATGKNVRSFSVGDYYDEHGYDVSIAASDDNLFFWRSEDKLAVYDFRGKSVGEITLPRPGYAYSLSYCNGMLWIAEDADGGTEGDKGQWYGYRLE